VPSHRLRSADRLPSAGKSALEHIIDQALRGTARKCVRACEGPAQVIRGPGISLTNYALRASSMVVVLTWPTSASWCNNPAVAYHEAFWVAAAAAAPVIALANTLAVSEAFKIREILSRGFDWRDLHPLRSRGRWRYLRVVAAYRVPYWGALINTFCQAWVLFGALLSLDAAHNAFPTWFALYAEFIGLAWVVLMTVWLAAHPAALKPGSRRVPRRRAAERLASEASNSGISSDSSGDSSGMPM
jgi:hypothetical protein